MNKISVEDYKNEAYGLLPKSVLSYYKSGATNEKTLQENFEAIDRWYIRQRFLIDVSKIDTSTSILGHKVSMPIGVAPTGMQKMAHPDGECGNAWAAAKHETVFNLSTIANTSIEEVAKESGLKFFQLYIYKDKEVTRQLVRRAELGGFSALALTVDAPIFGIRYEDIRNKFSMPSHLRFANFETSEKSNFTSKGGSGINEYVKTLFAENLTWKDFEWLKSITKLPIILKGIMTAEDAKIGVEKGAAAIWVSNHGARQLDGVLSSIDALPEIVSAVGDKCEVYVDGGFQTGTSVFKALALGAKMVFVGRPMLWGLSCDGKQGAHHVLQILRSELINTMKLTGVRNIDEITSNHITNQIPSKM